MEITGLNKPIFIIAGVRSGTTMIGDILGKHKDLAYWIEPKYIWKYRKPRGKNDHRFASEATAKVKNYIRKRFHNYTLRLGKTRFIEKTPSNVFRVSFIEEVFPDALYIRLLRNGIDTALSAEKKWTSTPTKSALLRRLRSNEIPLIDLPFYFGAFMRDVVGRFFAPQKGYLWGQLFEGISAFRAQHTTIETCAKQWSEGLVHSQRALDKVSAVRVYTLKYEDLIADPQGELKLLLDFCQLNYSPEVISYALKNVKSKVRIYSAEEKEKIDLIMPIISKQMIKYNYA